MSTRHYNQNTTSTPEQFIAGLTDLGPGRSEPLGNSANDYLNVRPHGPDHADVTERAGGVWEHPNRIVAITKSIARHWEAFVSPDGMRPPSTGPTDSQAPTTGMVC